MVSGHSVCREEILTYPQEPCFNEVRRMTDFANAAANRAADLERHLEDR